MAQFVLKITTLSLIEVFTKKCWVLLLIQNSLLLMPFLFMVCLEISLLETQTLKPLVWLFYIDNIFFIWMHSEEGLKEFMTELNSFYSNIKFTYEYNKRI